MADDAPSNRELAWRGEHTDQDVRDLRRDVPGIVAAAIQPLVDDIKEIKDRARDAVNLSPVKLGALAAVVAALAAMLSYITTHGGH